MTWNSKKKTKLVHTPKTNLHHEPLQGETNQFTTCRLAANFLGTILVSTSPSKSCTQLSKFVPSDVPCFISLGAKLSHTARTCVLGSKCSAGKGSVMCCGRNSILPYADSETNSNMKYAFCCAMVAPSRMADSTIASKSSMLRNSCSMGSAALRNGRRISSRISSTVRLRRAGLIRCSRIRALVLRQSWNWAMYSWFASSSIQTSVLMRLLLFAYSSDIPGVSFIFIWR
jgi:hypothetical protein